jgi:phage gpG-like protein
VTDGVKIEIDGDERLSRTMHAAARDIETIDMSSVAGEIARDAATRAPRLTGSLARSIRPSHAAAVATVESDVVYAGRTEFGWAKVNQPAQPFMRPAAAAHMTDAVREAGRQAQRALDGVKGA